MAPPCLLVAITAEHRRGFSEGFLSNSLLIISAIRRNHISWGRDWFIRSVLVQHLDSGEEHTAEFWGMVTNTCNDSEPNEVTSVIVTSPILPKIEHAAKPRAAAIVSYSNPTLSKDSSALWLCA